MDVPKRLRTICDQLQISFILDGQFSNPQIKYDLLNECARTFNATVPNSQLSEIHNIGN